MKEKTILIIFLIALSLTREGAGAASHCIEKAKKTCSYLIEVETTCAMSAETTDHISVRFTDSAGNLLVVKRLKNPKLVYVPKRGVKNPYKGFGRCAIDMFETRGACVDGSICSLYLKRVGSDGWRPGWVKVFRGQDGGNVIPISYTFYFRTFLPENVWYGFNYCHLQDGFVSPHAASLEGLHE